MLNGDISFVKLQFLMKTTLGVWHAFGGKLIPHDVDRTPYYELKIFLKVLHIKGSPMHTANH